MAKVPRITGEQAKRAFSKIGFHQIRMAGSHCILKCQGQTHHLSIPMHSGKTIGTGLLAKLIKTAGLTVEEFVELL